jgi:hypothetical protein
MDRIILLAIGMLAVACYSTSTQAAISSLIVTGATVSKSTGIATVSGTIVCTAGDTVAISALLFQAIGQHVGLAQGFTFVSPCSGRTDAWTTTNTLNSVGSFQPGPAGLIDQASELAPLV